MAAVMNLCAVGPRLANAAADAPVPSPIRGVSTLVSLAPDGRLHYRAYSELGDVIPDFSHCGFAGGGVALPQAQVVETLDPQPTGDDTEWIQGALDRVAQLPVGADGLRGAVRLKRGHYRVAGPLVIRASGVVLRGDGDEVDGTVITATARKQQPLITLGARTSPREEKTSGGEVTDAGVPVGARKLHVADATGFAPGQNILVIRRGNAAWIREIGMNRIATRPGAPGSTRQWEPFDLRFDRVVMAVSGNEITIDAPIGCAIEARWGGGVVVRYAESRPERCGVEWVRAISVFDKAKTTRIGSETGFIDEAHATHAVVLDNVKNAWVRHVTTEHFYHGPARVGGRAKWITIEDCRALAPVSEITGGRRYPYDVNGQLTLVQRCYSDQARHAFVFGSRVPGPNVFLNCRSEHDYATSEPHHRWSVAGLYDNVEARMAIQDRQWMGSGHGWAGANYVVWNSRGELVCQRPPTAQNFAVGFVGKRGRDAFERPTGWWESEGAPVQPTSLYQQQLRDRLGGR